MKRLSLIALLSVALSVMAIGQDTKMWIGGYLQFSNTNDDGVKTSGFGIMPDFGYVVNSDFTVGGGIGFFTSSTKNSAGDKDTDNTFSLKPFVRYTAIRLEKISFFAQADLPLNFYSGTNFDGSSKDGYNTVGINILPGISYSINEKWAASLKMPSILSFYTSSNDYTRVSFGVNNGYTIQNYLLNSTIGFIYKF